MATRSYGGRLAALLGFVLYFGEGLALAQGTTGTITGRVTDDTGAIVPGITVTVTGPALLGGPQVRTTDHNGTFRFPVLPAGVYEVLFELAGFERLRRDSLVLQAQRTITLDQVLRPASVQEVVTVSAAAPPVDVKNSQVATTVDAKLTAELPTARDFRAVADALPGVHRDVGENSVYGSPQTNNVYTVDGINVGDPHVSTVSHDIAYEDIQEFQISTSGQSAEHGNASGGAFNFVMKSGSNTFHGVSSSYFQTEDLTSDNTRGDVEPTIVRHRYDFGGNLGGPIVRDRVWFFTSHWRDDQAIAETLRPDIDLKTDTWQQTLKVDAQLHANHRVTGTYMRRDQTIHVPWFLTVGTRDDPRTWSGRQQDSQVRNLNYSGTLGSSTVVQAWLGAVLFDWPPILSDLDPGPIRQFQSSFGPTITSGAPTFPLKYQQRDRVPTVRFTLSQFVSDLAGTHDFRVGFTTERVRTVREFGDIADTGGVRQIFRDDAPFRVTLNQNEIRSRMTLKNHSVFAQDQWAVTPTLTLNLGVRLDLWRGAVGPERVLGNAFFPEVGQPEFPNVASLESVGPRLGVAWDPTGNRKWAVKGSWARQFRGLDTVTLDVYDETLRGQTTYAWSDPNGDGLYQRGEEGRVISSDPAVAIAPNFELLDEDLKLTHTDTYNLSVEVELADGWGLSLGGIYKRDGDILGGLDLNRPFDRAYVPLSVTNPLNGLPMTIFTLRPEYGVLPDVPFWTNDLDPGIERKYRGLQAVVRKTADRWSLLGSYNLGQNYGNWATTFDDQQHSGWPHRVFGPNGFVNATGDQTLDRRHMAKVLARYDLPYGVQVSGVAQLLSGVGAMFSRGGEVGTQGARRVRFTPANNPGILTEPEIEVNAEPPGSLRFEPERTLDLRVQKRFRLWGPVTVDGILDLFNVFNANTVLEVESLNVDDGPSFMRPTTIMNPRAARLGVRVNF